MWKFRISIYYLHTVLTGLMLIMNCIHVWDRYSISFLQNGFLFTFICTTSNILLTKINASICNRRIFVVNTQQLYTHWQFMPKIPEHLPEQGTPRPVIESAGCRLQKLTQPPTLKGHPWPFPPPKNPAVSSIFDKKYLMDYSQLKRHLSEYPNIPGMHLLNRLITTRENIITRNFAIDEIF